MARLKLLVVWAVVITLEIPGYYGAVDVTLPGMYTTECLLSPAGHEYAGTVTTTQSGRTCQAWNSKEPHHHSYMNDPCNFPGCNVAASSNYCRNPDYNWQGGTWCFTAEPNKRWESCNITLCECKVTATGYEYEGRVNATSSGRSCQAWSSQTPHNHTYTHGNQFPDELLADTSNYCRNPGGVNASRLGGPWCYTTDSQVVWEGCDIPTCGFELVTVLPPPTTSTTTTSTTASTTTRTTASTTTSSTASTTIGAATTSTATPRSTTVPPTGTTGTTTRRTTATSTPRRTTTTTTPKRTTTTTTTKPKTSTTPPKEVPDKDEEGRPAASTDQGSSRTTVIASVVTVVTIVLIGVIVLVILYRKGIIPRCGSGSKERLEESYDNPSFNVEKNEVNINGK